MVAKDRLRQIAHLCRRHPRCYRSHLHKTQAALYFGLRTALTFTRLKLLSVRILTQKDTLTSSSAAYGLSSSDPQRQRSRLHFCYAYLHAPASSQPRVSSQMRGCLSQHSLRLPASTASQLRLHNRYAAAAGYSCSLTLTSARLRLVRFASVCANERHVERTRCKCDRVMLPDDSWLHEAADRPSLKTKH